MSDNNMSAHNNQTPVNESDSQTLSQQGPSLPSGTLLEIIEQLSDEELALIATQCLDHLRNGRIESLALGHTAVCGLDGGSFRLMYQNQLGKDQFEPIEPCTTGEELWDLVYMTRIRRGMAGQRALPLMEVYKENMPFPHHRPDGATEDIPGPFLLTQMDIQPSNIRVGVGAFAGFVSDKHVGFFPGWWQWWAIRELYLSTLRYSANHPNVRWVSAMQDVLEQEDDADQVVVAAAEHSKEGQAAFARIVQRQLEENQMCQFRDMVRDVDRFWTVHLAEGLEADPESELYGTDVQALAGEQDMWHS